MTSSDRPPREALAVAAVAGCVAAVVYGITLALDDPGTPFGPGELDLLLGARMMAAGILPPVWVGAVHPDAIGTWLASATLAPLLRAGVPDVAALKLVAGAHYALLVATTSGLTARLGGRRAGALAAGVLVLGAPSVLAAHSKYLATTVEAASLEVALLWAAIEVGRRNRLRHLVPLGLAWGLAVAYSLHAAVALPLALAAALGVGARRRVLAPTLVLAAAALVQVPFIVLRDPLGPMRPPFSIKSLGLGQLTAMLDPADLVTLAARWPFALLHGTENIPVASWTRWLHVPLALLLGASLLGALVLLARRALPEGVAPVALFGLGAGAPLLIAGDLIGYPAAYRYFVPALAAAAVLFALAATSSARRAPVPAAALALLLAPGLLAVPRATSTELSRPAAAYVAGQHRLSLARHPVHTHFLMLTPFVGDAEIGGWVQGYGRRLGREFRRTRAALLRERETVRTRPEVGVPDRLDRLWVDAQPGRWLEAVDWIGGTVRERFLVGIGLGIGEDGVIDGDEALLIEACTPADRAAVWGGIGAAAGERWHWVRDGEPLTLAPSLASPDGDAAGSFAAGLRFCGGEDAPAADALLPGITVMPGRTPYLTLPHPLTYSPPAPRAR